MNALITLLLAGTEAAHEAAAEAAAFPTEALVGTNHLLWIIPALPLLGAAINLAIGARLQRAGKENIASSIAVGVMVLATLYAWFSVLPTLLGQPVDQRYLGDTVWSMFSAGSLNVEMAFAIDPLSMVMVLIILTIATGIHIYSVGYMHGDPIYWKFFVYLNYFVFSMLLLVMGDNFLVMFFGWEGVGLASYLLIGFWHQDVEKAKAGSKAFIVNRFGDFGFILGLFALFWALGGNFVGGDWRPQEGAKAMRHEAAAPTMVVGASQTEIPVGPTLNFRELRNQIVIQETGVAVRLVSMTFWGLPLMAIIGILFFIGATGKSAQIPLFVWLPDAMAGPTPVSALIHAATMVTAGVYMVARLNFLYSLSPIAMTVVAMVGATTALLAATIGFFQHDIKKVLAYSTVSQLGYMFVGVGIGAYWLGIFHLLNHACFKACLFLGSGSVIHGCHHEQDMRKMGGLKKLMPITAWTYLVATIAIVGLPIANAFYSKDEILWKALTGENLLVPGWIPWLLGLIGAMGTAYYMWRSYVFTFKGEYRGEVHEAHGEEHGDDHGHHGGLPHESPRSMTWVLVFLAVLSILTLFLGLPHALGFHPWLEAFLSPVMAGSEPLLAFAALGEHPVGIEWTLIIVGGLVVPIGGYFVARYFYEGKGMALRDALAENQDTSFGPLPLKASVYGPVYRLLYDKYRVDELYDWLIIQPFMKATRAAAAFDKWVVDGAVNVVGHTGRIVCESMSAVDRIGVDGAVLGVARVLDRAGKGLTELQASTVRTYFYSVLGGALVIVVLNYVLF
ncbi:MAG: NADH-quinone oxidoreductase subunit L [Deltaproteobacteria bacterium]|nr:NADH-quinone oxidoreductase subunit L [Deltaproteobacteria bacterium]